jgi:hypothetical protein
MWTEKIMVMDNPRMHRWTQCDALAEPPTRGADARGWCSHDQTRAARLLVISRDALPYRLRKFGLATAGAACDAP